MTDTLQTGNRRRPAPASLAGCAPVSVGSAVSRLCAALIEGLMYCACAHHAVDPDLLDCIAEARSKQPSGRAGTQS